MRGCITPKQKEINSKHKHSWIQTGNKNESRCWKCGLIKRKDSTTKYYLNNQEVIQQGCVPNKTEH